MTSPELLSQIDKFLAATGMGPTYFGQRAVGNSKLVARLRAGRPVNLETALRVRQFMAAEGTWRTARRAASISSEEVVA